MTDQSTDQSDWVMVPREKYNAASNHLSHIVGGFDLAIAPMWASGRAKAARHALESFKPAPTPPDEMVALELAARNFPDGPGAKERLAIAALNYARAAIAAITEGRGG